ncbi:Multidrug resistance protein ABC Superfamily [Phytophthora palmivora]|uniref:Multidrug resistance protein ABC Superfamily n=1 Tax=Phytophthora palmivora TaxID=4796 RepID=A0A2P4X4C4_9STRA|nr:Multidrug resistance protein ABC Superfamily [Phytophthora palmivora]
MAPTDYIAANSPKDPPVQTANKDDDDVPVFENATGNSDVDPKVGGKLVSLSELLSFADGKDRMLMIAGTIGAAVAGMAQPLQIVLIGDVLNGLNPSDSSTSIVEKVDDAVLNYVYVAVAAMIAGFLQVACWSTTASRQVKQIRSAYMTSIVTKEIGWFDVNEPMQLSTRIIEAAVTIHEGMGRKIGDGVHSFSMAMSGVTIGLIKGWDMALILIALMPFVAYTAFLSMKAVTKATQTGIEAYGQAGAIAQESLSNVRTVHTFNACNYFIDKYKKALDSAARAGINKGFAVGWGTGLMFFTMLCTYAVGMFYGAHKVANDQLDDDKCTGSGCYDGGRVVVVFAAVLTGSMAIGQAAPSAEAVVAARAAAYDVFQTIRRVSLIDPLRDDGKILENVSGEIEIKDVSFAYPSRPDAHVCSNYSLTVRAGETVALVGPSGSGKSTIVSLLERFYDPLSGTVSVDGVDVRELNVKWLRQQIGLVGQEPVLFPTTIMENIRHGCPQASDDQVMEAARMANALNFVQELPQGFNTEVGERGTQLSGGQKQRIAIARAIVKKPPILLLDEATSALDTESEYIVQKSLDHLLARSKRTTIVIAHRLSTIRNADRIVVHNNGIIAEIGSHDELMKISNGQYRKLVDSQISPDKDDTEVSELTDPKDLVASEMTTKNSMAAKTEDDNAKPEAETATSQPTAVMDRVRKMASPEWKFLVAGGIGAILNAGVFPAWGVMMAKITVLFFDYTKTEHEMIHDARYWSLGFVALGVIYGLSTLLQQYCFAVASERLIGRVRLETFSAMLHQDIGWFDMPENASGALLSRLSSDAATLKAMTSETLNRLVVNLTTLVIVFAVCFYFSWQMTLILLAAAPLLTISSFLVNKSVADGDSTSKKNNDADATAGALLTNAIDSIRTVASLGLERDLACKYKEYLEMSKKTDTRAGVVAGAAFGFSLGVMLLVAALLFYVSARWISKGTITFEDMFAVLMVFSLSSFSIGSAAQGATDPKKAQQSAENIFKIIDRAPLIGALSMDGHTISPVKGSLEFHEVRFAYPSRPDAPIYQGYNLKIAPGQTVALVGGSGCGKSTAIALLERFYDPHAGMVTLDGVDLRQLQLPWLRDRISLVSQEPVLFAGTVAENIAIGKPTASREEIIQAAKDSSALDFIRNLPDGFETNVGDRGGQLSGGQKQRIALARAILRDPDILLLDEATSALDNESERVVQASLNRLLQLKQRTTIVVAHRLSTIRNADLIAVTDNGTIIELGTHDELMQLPNGRYKQLLSRQTR